MLVDSTYTVMYTPAHSGNKNAEIKNKLIDNLMRIQNESGLKEELSKNIKSMAIGNATELIVKEIEEILEA